MKSEVGMYCYNKTNRKLGIGKIISFQCNNNVNIKYKNDIELVSIGNVIASFDITDILKVGDYVNGHEVKDIDYAFDDIALNVKNPRIVPYIDNIKNAYIDNIKSVITHEQMEQMSYKVEE